MASNEKKDKIKELELVLEAKRNINNLLLTIMTVFYALNGILLSITVSNQSLTRIEMIPIFGIISMIFFSLITGRMRSTNTNCDKRAEFIENKLNFEVIKNYSIEKCPHKPRFLYAIPMHRTIMLFNTVIIFIWIIILLYSFKIL